MPATAGTILRREHLVAACLVGTVVVVVGFASGLGLTKPAAGSAQTPQDTTMPPMSQSEAPANSPGGDSGGGSGSGPVDYVGTPAGLAAVPIGGSPVVAITTTPSSDPPPSTTGSPPPTTGTPPTTTGTPPTCEIGLLTALLNQAATAANGLPVVGPLAPQLTGTLFGNCSDTSTTDGVEPARTATPTTAPSGLLGLPLPGSTGTGS